MDLKTYIQRREAEIKNTQKTIEMLKSLPQDLSIVSLSNYGAFTDGILSLEAGSLDEAFKLYDRLKAENLVIVRGNGTTSFKPLSKISEKENDIATHVGQFTVNLSKLDNYPEELELAWVTCAGSFMLSVKCVVKTHAFKILKHDILNDFGKKQSVRYEPTKPNGAETVSWAMGKDFSRYTFYWYSFGSDLHPKEVLS